MLDHERIINFIRRLYNKPKGFIPLHKPLFFGNEKKYLSNCIDSTFVSSVGKYVEDFEQILQKYTGVKRAIATVNGTNALQIALLGVGVAKNSEVITQSLSFIATSNAISYLHATPVYVDVDKSTMGMSPDFLLDWLKENVTLNKSNKPINKNTNREISACLPMHTFGHPCEIDKIVEICDNYNIPVVEDAAESIGSFYKGKHTGNYGKASVISFNGNKTITTGGGGAILTNNNKLADHLKHLINQAKINHSWEYKHDFIGYNFRMPNVNAAIGLAQMEVLSSILDSKKKIFQKYRDFFNKIEIDFFSEPIDSNSNYWLNSVILDNREQKEDFLKIMNMNGINCRPIWSLINNQNMYKNCQHGDLSNSKWLEDRVVNIPSSPSLLN